MGVCMPYGNGNIYEQVAGTSNYNDFNNLRLIFSDLKTFNLPTYFTPINNDLSSIVTTTDDYSLSKMMDITDQASLTILAGLSSPSGLGCNANLNADSYVPSNSQNSQTSFLINCSINNGN